MESEIHGSSRVIQARKYDKELESYDKVIEETRQLERQLEEQREKVEGMRERKMMLDEDERSQRFNFEQGLAEQEYCEEVLQNYQTEYEGESKLILGSLSLEDCNWRLKEQVETVEEEVRKAEKEMLEWKEEVEYELNEKKTKNKMVQLRMELMRTEERADAFANKSYMMKFRELLCVCFKNLVKEKQLQLTSEDIEEGMELFMCRENALSEYQDLVSGYKNKSKDKYPDELVKEYFDTLEKIDAVFRKGRIYQDRQILKQYKKEMEAMRMQVIGKEEVIIENERKLKQNEEQVEVILADESVAAIECMREVEGRYDLAQIKSKLKSIKEEQISRIKFIREIYTASRRRSQPNMSDVDYLNEKQHLQDLLKEEVSSLKHLQHKHRRVMGEKERAEEEISMAVSKWQETSNKKKRLKSLYKELSQTSNPTFIQAKKCESVGQATTRKRAKGNSRRSSR